MTNFTWKHKAILSMMFAAVGLRLIDVLTTETDLSEGAKELNPQAAFLMKTIGVTAYFTVDMALFFAFMVVTETVLIHIGKSGNKSYSDLAEKIFIGIWALQVIVGVIVAALDIYAL